MTIEQIKNEYAKDRGRDSWKKLVQSYAVDGEMLTSTFLKHENAVIQIVQDELLNKVTENVKNLLESEKVGEIFIEDYQLILKSILNTENIK